MLTQIDAFGVGNRSANEKFLLRQRKSTNMIRPSVDDGVVQFSRIGSNEAADCFVRPRTRQTGKCTKRQADTETMTQMDRDGERRGRGRVEGSELINSADPLIETNFKLSSSAIKPSE